MLIIPVSVTQLVKTPHGQACTRASRVIGRLPSVAIAKTAVGSAKLPLGRGLTGVSTPVNDKPRIACALARYTPDSITTSFLFFALCHSLSFPNTPPAAFNTLHYHYPVHITTFPHTQNGYLHERRRTATTSSFEAAAGPPSTLRGDTFASLQLLRRTATAFPRGLRSRKRVETRGGDPHTRVLGRGRGRAESPREGQHCCMGGRDRDSGRSFSDPGNPPVRNEPNDHAGDANARMLAARLQCREHHEPQLLHFRRRVRAVSPHVHVAESELVARCGRRPRTF
jgi:hypothetical protein